MAMLEALKANTDNVLKTLSPREEKVLKMRFGLDDGSERTLEEVGQTLLRHPGENPPDRVQGVAQAPPPVAQPEAEGVPSYSPLLRRSSRYARSGLPVRRYNPASRRSAALLPGVS